MAFIQSDLLPMYSKPRPILPTPPIFHKQPLQLALISGASKGRLQKSSRQSFAIFNLFRTEREQAREPKSTWFHRPALIIAGLVSKFQAVPGTGSQTLPFYGSFLVPRGVT